MVEVCTNILVYISALAAGTFVVRYMRTGWHRTEAGRHMMAFMGVTAVLLSLSVVRRLVKIPEEQWIGIRFSAFLALTWVLVRNTVLLFRYQKDNKKDVS